MPKFAILMLTLTFVLSGFAGCESTVNNSTDIGSTDIEAELDAVLENASYLSDWNRVATYTDGVDMQTGPAILTFLDDGTFVSSTSVCTATGDYTVNATDESEAETMTMSYVQSNCPGFTVSSMTYSYEISANEDGQEVLTLNADYMGHVVTEVYTR